MRTRSLVFVGVVVMSACNPGEEKCSEGQQPCDGVCVDVATSAQHCGACDQPCDDGEGCVDGACVSGCALPSGFVDAGVIAGCQVCEPFRSSTSLSPRTDGTACATGVCHGGQCEGSCFIDGVFVTDGADNSENVCERCLLSSGRNEWTVLTNGFTCGSNTKVCHDGACVDGCFIDGSSWSPGALNQTNPCEQCSPQVSKLAWTPVANGAGCGAPGMACVNGACAEACNIVGNTTYATGTINPANACQRCDPSNSTTTWTPVEVGTSCGAGLICANETCVDACFIDGGVKLNGTSNFPNTCEFCDTTQSSTAWQLFPEGSACGTFSFCFSNQCQFGCRVDQATYTHGTVNPANPCEFCDPFHDFQSWTAFDAGTACGNGQVCNGNTCGAGCFIDNTTWTTGASNPMNACEVCAPGTSTTAWSMRASGEACGNGLICSSGTCAAQCFIDGGFVDAGAFDPATLCRACLPATSTSGYSQQNLVTLLEPGTSVAAQGWSLFTIGTRSITDDGGVITLSTAFTGGAGGGAQQLLYRRISQNGGPFTLRVDWRVDAVNAHNQYDSAAAILGSLTGQVGTQAERGQMVYVDPARVGWSDDTQFSPIDNIDGGFHLYELAVAADAGARFSVDGVQLLSRGNFVTNGIIAIGDQTNDPNTESTISLRSVTLICQ